MRAGHGRFARKRPGASRSRPFLFEAPKRARERGRRTRATRASTLERGRSLASVEIPGRATTGMRPLHTASCGSHDGARRSLPRSGVDLIRERGRSSSGYDQAGEHAAVVDRSSPPEASVHWWGGVGSGFVDRRGRRTGMRGVGTPAQLPSSPGLVRRRRRDLRAQPAWGRSDSSRLISPETARILPTGPTA